MKKHMTREDSNMRRTIDIGTKKALSFWPEKEFKTFSWTVWITWKQLGAENCRKMSIYFFKSQYEGKCDIVFAS